MMKPSLRGVPQYLTFLRTTGSLDIPWKLFSLTSPVFPPFKVAWAWFLSNVHVSMLPSATWDDFHLTGKTCGRISPRPCRCSAVTDLSKVTTTQSICPEEKSPPRSPLNQSLAPAKSVLP